MARIRGPEQERQYRKLRRATVDALGLQSASQLTDEQRDVITDLAVERGQLLSRSRGRRSRNLSWNGPLARYLAMIGRRPIREGVDIGDYNDRRVGKRLSWEDV